MSSNAILLEKNLNLCDGLTCDYRFWVAVCCSALVEPLLCANYHEFGMYTAQAIVLFVSVAFYVVQILGEVARHRDLLTMGVYGFFMHFLGRGEYVLEFICLVTGMSFLYTYPGIAALRCFRVFRLLWLSNNAGFRANVVEHLSPFLGEEFIDRCFRVFRFAIRALSALGNEMFRLTEKTRGGLFLMLVLFYMAFVFGIVLWIETGNPDNECNALGPCMYVMLRITFFDGTGLDYAYSLVGSHSFLFFLVMCYMSISAFGVINGMIGIFATVFASAAEEAFVEGWPENDASAGSGAEAMGGKQPRSGHVGVASLVSMHASPSAVSPCEVDEMVTDGPPSPMSLRGGQATDRLPKPCSSSSFSQVDDAAAASRRPQSSRRLFSLVPQTSNRSLSASASMRKPLQPDAPPVGSTDSVANAHVHDVCVSLQAEVTVLRDEVRQLVHLVQSQHAQWQQVEALLQRLTPSAQTPGQDV